MKVLLLNEGNKLFGEVAPKWVILLKGLVEKLKKASTKVRFNNVRLFVVSVSLGTFVLISFFPQ